MITRYMNRFTTSLAQTEPDCSKYDLHEMIRIPECLCKGMSMMNLPISGRGENYVDVYASSGQAGTTRWLSTPSGQAFLANADDPTLAEKNYNLAEMDPTRYGMPRQVRIGLMLTF